MADEVLIGLKEAGRKLSFGETKVRNLIARGDLEAVLVDGRLRVPVTALQSFVDRLPRAEPLSPRPAPRT